MKTLVLAVISFPAFGAGIQTAVCHEVRPLDRQMSLHREWRCVVRFKKAGRDGNLVFRDAAGRDLANTNISKGRYEAYVAMGAPRMEPPATVQLNAEEPFQILLGEPQ